MNKYRNRLCFFLGGTLQGSDFINLTPINAPAHMQVTCIGHGNIYFRKLQQFKIYYTCVVIIALKFIPTSVPKVSTADGLLFLLVRY